MTFPRGASVICHRTVQILAISLRAIVVVAFRRLPMSRSFDSPLEPRARCRRDIGPPPPRLRFAKKKSPSEPFAQRVIIFRASFSSSSMPGCFAFRDYRKYIIIVRRHFHADDGRPPAPPPRGPCLRRHSPNPHPTGASNSSIPRIASPRRRR